MKQHSFTHTHEIGTISLEGTPIDEKPIIQFIEDRSEPITPAPQTEHKQEKHLPADIKQTADAKQKQWFVGSIDQGTTSSRFLIFNHEGEPVANYQIEFDNLYPESG
jgi:glycerol kinase